MHLILTGATGTAGSAVLKHCLADPAITRLSILSRRPIPQADGHSKANVIIHPDFTSYPRELLSQLEGAKACIWALGISQTQVKKDEYVKADQTEKAMSLFAKVKGRTEKTLLALPQQSTDLSSLRIYNIRPGAIDPEGEILKTTPPSALERYGGMIIFPLLRTRMMKSFVIGTNPLAKTLIQIAKGDGEPIPAGKGVEYDGRVLRNTALRRMAGLDKD
ncbi:hypothetical protein Clacol_000810 [Clathrus columnatus]|uniref:Nucleoside-diphosphate-sugar epimerase n=1 Tax=Clathrus columnatus TaxID=1419009 RepID=A0AAV4ZX81_9AGAM|nr:hypothetical protein Clacol_000810 [Clathrus columnatus]